MNKIGTFYPAGEMNIQKIIEPYQRAFAGPPWYEVSKCADRQLPQRCVGGLSRTAINSLCGTCSLAPDRPAYEAGELLERFTTLEQSRPLNWYAEETDGGIAVASLAWMATPETIATEKYADDPDMKPWLEETFGEQEIVWLDEVFADKTVRADKNLTNFKAMCNGYRERFDTPVLAYRTISEAMTRVAFRDFNATPLRNVPDTQNRSFIVIDSEKELS